MESNNSVEKKINKHGDVTIVHTTDLAASSNREMRFIPENTQYQKGKSRLKWPKVVQVACWAQYLRYEQTKIHQLMD